MARETLQNFDSYIMQSTYTVKGCSGAWTDPSRHWTKPGQVGRLAQSGKKTQLY